MKKILFLIIATVAFAGISFSQEAPFAPFKETVEAPAELAAKVPWVSGPFLNVTLDQIKAGFPGYPMKEILAFIKANPGKKVVFPGDNQGVVSQVVYNSTIWDETLKAMSKEEIIAFYRATNTQWTLMKFGVVTFEDIVSNACVQYGFDNRNIINSWTAQMLSAYSGEKYEVVLEKLFKLGLAQGRIDNRYQKWFKSYLKSLPLAEAKTVVSNELRAFLEIANPENKKHNAWLTQLRVLNTSYQEL